MVLESTIICVDNSEFMRNGDYLPTRLQAQQVIQSVSSTVQSVSGSTWITIFGPNYAVFIKLVVFICTEKDQYVHCK